MTEDPTAETGARATPGSEPTPEPSSVATTDPRGMVPPSPPRLDRRQLVFGLGAVAAVAPALALLRPGGDADPGGSRAAQGAATPGALPTAGATPAPPAETLGSLEVVRDPRPAYPGPPVPGGELRLALDAAAVGEFSPAALRQPAQVPASYLDPLVRPDEVTLEPRPWLAERWAWDEEGRTVTYELRRDVRWHDGTPFTAADVRFTLFVYRDDVQSGVRNLFALMDDVEEVDDHTVRVRLLSPDGGWLLNASSQFVFQRAQYTEYWNSRPEGQRTLVGFDHGDGGPVGTGPWVVGERSETEVVFTRNDEYWAGPPAFETLRLAAEPDAARRLSAWRAGDLDVLTVRAAELPDLGDAPGRLHVVDAARVMFAAFNFDNPTLEVPDRLADLRLRRALSLALDRERYAAEVFGGFTRADASGTIAQPWAHDPGSVNPPRDLAAARALLEEAGWLDRDGDGIREDAAGRRLDLTLIAPENAHPDLLATLRSLGPDLAEVGVLLDLEILPPDAFDERWVVRRSHDLVAFAYPLYPGFTDFDLYGSAWDLRVNPQGFNPGGYANPEADRAIADALVAFDLDAQQEALARLQRAANDDLFGLWLGFPQDLVLVRPDILGFRPHALLPTWDTRTLWRRPD